MISNKYQVSTKINGTTYTIACDDINEMWLLGASLNDERDKRQKAKRQKSATKRQKEILKIYKLASSSVIEKITYEAANDLISTSMLKKLNK